MSDLAALGCPDEHDDGKPGVPPGLYLVAFADETGFMERAPSLTAWYPPYKRRTFGSVRHELHPGFDVPTLLHRLQRYYSLDGNRCRLPMSLQGAGALLAAQLRIPTASTWYAAN